jgi:23S rRNA (uracil1939-C5)-methyltransferase
MLARHDGRIVFVAGAIPGERVLARIERETRQSLWATTVEVIDPSPDRVEPACDPACGGSTFAHIRYDRQRELKQQILVDAFRRLARLSLDEAPAVAASPASGYRLRARLHVAGGRVGYYLEGTHALCDAAATSQLLAEATIAVTAAVAALGPRAGDCGAIVVSENVAATERVLHLEPRERARLDDVGAEIARLPTSGPAIITGVTTVVRGAVKTIVGAPGVTDTAETLFRGASPFAGPVAWSRRAPAFFQGNRFLIGALVRRVLDAAQGDRVADLYAGVGLFSVALAARGAEVTAVEGDAIAAGDLATNAAPWGARLRVVRATVEEAVRRPPTLRPTAVVLDPPRAGLSAGALQGLAAWRVQTLVYVSCDPPTLARDAARLVASGYRLASVDAFDLFPNTPHVEALAVFTLAGS